MKSTTSMRDYEPFITEYSLTPEEKSRIFSSCERDASTNSFLQTLVNLLKTGKPQLEPVKLSSLSSIICDRYEAQQPPEGAKRVKGGWIVSNGKRGGKFEPEVESDIDKWMKAHEFTSVDDIQTFAWEHLLRNLDGVMEAPVFKDIRLSDLSLKARVKKLKDSLSIRSASDLRSKASSSFLEEAIIGNLALMCFEESSVKDKKGALVSLGQIVRRNELPTSVLEKINTTIIGLPAIWKLFIQDETIIRDMDTVCITKSQGDLIKTIRTAIVSNRTYRINYSTPPGSGKTSIFICIPTLIKKICEKTSLRSQDYVTVFLSSKEIILQAAQGMTEITKNIGFVFDNCSVLETEDTTIENVRLFIQRGTISTYFVDFSSIFRLIELLVHCQKKIIFFFDEVSRGVDNGNEIAIDYVTRILVNIIPQTFVSVLMSATLPNLTCVMDLWSEKGEQNFVNITSSTGHSVIGRSVAIDYHGNYITPVSGVRNKTELTTRLEFFNKNPFIRVLTSGKILVKMFERAEAIAKKCGEILQVPGKEVFSLSFDFKTFTSADIWFKVRELLEVILTLSDEFVEEFLSIAYRSDFGEFDKGDITKGYAWNFSGSTMIFSSQNPSDMCRETMSEVYDMKHQHVVKSAKSLTRESKKDDQKVVIINGDSKRRSTRVKASDVKSEKFTTDTSPKLLGGIEPHLVLRSREHGQLYRTSAKHFRYCTPLPQLSDYEKVDGVTTYTADLVAYLCGASSISSEEPKFRELVKDAVEAQKMVYVFAGSSEAYGLNLNVTNALFTEDFGELSQSTIYQAICRVGRGRGKGNSVCVLPSSVINHLFYDLDEKSAEYISSAIRGL